MQMKHLFHDFKTFHELQNDFFFLMHKDKKCKIVNLRSLSLNPTARGMALVTSNGLKQLKKKFTTLYTTKKADVGRKMWGERC